jgi:hypothetical protein
MARNGCTGSTRAGKVERSTVPSVCSTATGRPATPRNGCSTTKPVRAVRKSVAGVATPLNVRLPSLRPSMRTS